MSYVYATSFLTIQSMLHIIRQRLAHNQCDEVMEIAWGAMWNVTGKGKYVSVCVCVRGAVVAF